LIIPVTAIIFISRAGINVYIVLCKGLSGYGGEGGNTKKYT